MLAQQPPRRPGLTKRVLVILVLVVLALAGHRAAQVDGWLRPAVITGPSMQPTLWGPSYAATCPGCAAGQRFHASPTPGTLRCWNCGARQPTTTVRPLPADHVILDRAAYRWAPLGVELVRQNPRRGDLVAIGNGDSLRVKRVLGIPGDRISVQGNQLRINGHPVPTVLAEPVEPIPVHRQTIRELAPSDRRSTTGASSRDKTIDPASDRWRYRDPVDGGPRWLVYHHYSLHDRRPDVIRDDYPCNVTSVRRLNPVPRIGLDLTLRVVQPGTLRIALWSPEASQVYQVPLSAGMHHVRVPPPAASAENKILVPSPIPGNAPLPVDAQHPVAIAGLAELQPDHVRATVLRGLHWFLRRSDRGSWPEDERILSAGRYFVAGDNQPLSEDSRSAPEGIPFEQIVGRVVAR